MPALALALLLLLPVAALAQTPEPPPAAATPPPAAAAPTPPASEARAFSVVIGAMGRTLSGIPIDEVQLAAGPVVLLRVEGPVEQLASLVGEGVVTLLRRIAADAGIAPAGPALAVYTEITDTRFRAEVMVPVASPPATLPPGLSRGFSPEGRALRVRHVGSYETLEETYAEIEAFIEDRGLEIEEVFIERFLNSPESTPPGDLETEVHVLLK